MIDKLEQLRERYDELNKLIMDPDLPKDQKRYREVMQEHASLTETMQVYDEYRELLESRGLVSSGVYRDADLVEIVELPDHPWFVACQFHPEFRSRPGRAHPLFREFVRAARERNGGTS